MKWLSFIVVAAVVVGLAGCTGETGTVKGKDKKEFSLTTPTDTTIKQGETKEITVSVNRKNFDEDIDLTFDDLPSGVTIKEGDKKVAKANSKATFNLVAADDATPKDGHVVKVSGKSGDMKVGPLEFKVNVKKK